MIFYNETIFIIGLILIIIAVIGNQRLEIRDLTIGELDNTKRVVIGIIGVSVLILSIWPQVGISIPSNGDVVNSVSTPTPQPTKTPILFNVKITSPNENGNVSTNTIVEGTVSRALNDKEYLWILVSDDFSNWWPQEDAIRPSKHTLEWSGSARIGGGEGDIGKNFRIAVIIVNDMLNSRISEWQKECKEKQDWPPVTRDCIENYVIQEKTVDEVTVVLTEWTESPILSPIPKKIFSVSDAFYPSGWMGDWEDITFDDAFTDKPYSEPTCTKITYSIAQSHGEGWAGIYWQYPYNNWGDDPDGRDLTGTTKLTFWVRGENGGEKAEFKVGGITGEYPDSIQPSVSTGVIVMSDEWQQHIIDLTDKDLSHVIGAFLWVTTKTENPDGCTIYLDDVRFE